LERTAITGTTGYGAAVDVEYGGSLTLIDSTIDGNPAGGLAVTNANLTISGSTISNNSGGLYFVASGGESLSIANSTISGNTGSFAGGLLISGYGGALEIVNSTITDNTSSTSGSASGGLLATGAYTTLTLQNTIIAGNRQANNSSSDVLLTSGATFESDSSHNLIGYDPVTGNNLDDGVNDNIVGGEGSNPAVDPRLDVLDDYGGPTKTHALLSDSPAINMGDDDIADDFELEFDQRGLGFDRKSGAAVDIGAFEYGSGGGSGASLYAVSYEPETAAAADGQIAVALVGANEAAPSAAAHTRRSIRDVHRPMPNLRERHQALLLAINDLSVTEFGEDEITDMTPHVSQNEIHAQIFGELAGGEEGLTGVMPATAIVLT
jgi:hypothetical protein